MNLGLKRTIFTFILLAYGTASAIAQITIAPTNLFIDQRTKFGTYFVVNGSNVPQEINIDFIFSYSNTNENGERLIIEDDSAAADLHSAADWIRAFPRSFQLAPGERRVVRLRLTPPGDLDDGMYWARIRTVSTPVSPPVELQTNNDAVTASIGIRLESKTGAYYKQGEVNTGIAVPSLTAAVADDDILEVLANVNRLGNAPFLGSITANIYDADNSLVKSSFISTTIYFDGYHKQEVDVSDLPAGNYSVELMFESRRSDISTSDLVQMETATNRTSFVKQ